MHRCRAIPRTQLEPKYRPCALSGAATTYETRQELHADQTNAEAPIHWTGISVTLLVLNECRARCPPPFAGCATVMGLVWLCPPPPHIRFGARRPRKTKPQPGNLLGKPLHCNLEVQVQAGQAAPPQKSGFAPTVLVRGCVPPCLPAFRARSPVWPRADCAVCWARISERCTSVFSSIAAGRAVPLLAAATSALPGSRLIASGPTRVTAEVPQEVQLDITQLIGQGLVSIANLSMAVEEWWTGCASCLSSC